MLVSRIAVAALVEVLTIEEGEGEEGDEVRALSRLIVAGSLLAPFFMMLILTQALFPLFNLQFRAVVVVLMVVVVFVMEVVQQPLPPATQLLVMASFGRIVTSRRQAELMEQVHDEDCE